MRNLFLLMAIVAVGASLSKAEGEKPKFKIRGSGWVEGGRIMNSSDSTLADGSTNTLSSHTLNQKGIWLQSVGAQLTAEAQFTENLEGAFGFGTFQANHSPGIYDGNRLPTYYAISLFKNFISEARMTYFQGEQEAPGFSVTLGNFPYVYNRDTKNLGSYLLRGPVYPGLLFGGFKDFAIDSTKSNVMGARIHHETGGFSHDLIFKNEYEIPPTFDWSLAYVAKYRFLDAIEFGAGLNLYRLVPYDSRLEKPGRIMGDNGRSIDTANGDTTFFYSHQGKKVMGLFSLDFKNLFGIESMGQNDLKLYGEGAILGIENQGKLYSDIKQRMPVMVGFNFPTWGILDFLSIEVERYTSPYRNDMANLGALNGVADWTVKQRPTPAPVPVNIPYADSTNDNLKWSIYLEKIVANHVQFIGQVANDHYRPRPVATGLINAEGGLAAAMTAKRDWYFMFRVGYFF